MSSWKLDQALIALDIAVKEATEAIGKLQESIDQAISKWATNATGSSVQTLYKKFPQLQTAVWWPCDCYAITGGAYGMLSNCIMHLNDKHQWTRKQIADWLELLDLDITVKDAEGG